MFAASPHFSTALINGVKVNIELFQQIIQHDGEVEFFEDAHRMQYGNESTYREALRPSIIAERSLQQAMIEAAPEAADFLEVTLRVAEDLREEEIRYLFPD